MTVGKSMEISGTLGLLGVTPNMGPDARVGFSARGSFARSILEWHSHAPAAGLTMGVGDSVDVSIDAEFTGPCSEERGLEAALQRLIDVRERSVSRQ